VFETTLPSGVNANSRPRAGAEDDACRGLRRSGFIVRLRRSAPGVLWAMLACVGSVVEPSCRCRWQPLTWLLRSQPGATRASTSPVIVPIHAD
jgi:hypothetical protein